MKRNFLIPEKRLNNYVLKRFYHLTWQINSLSKCIGKEAFLGEFCFIGFIAKSMVSGTETWYHK